MFSWLDSASEHWRDKLKVADDLMADSDAAGTGHHMKIWNHDIFGYCARHSGRLRRWLSVKPVNFGLDKGLFTLFLWAAPIHQGEPPHWPVQPAFGFFG